MDGPIKRRRIKRRTLRNGIVAGIALVALLVGYAAITHFTARRAAQEHAATIAEMENTARQIVQQIENDLDRTEAQIEALADDSAIKSLFITADRENLQQAGRNHGRDIAHLLRLRLIPPDRFELEPDASPPLSYASLDLLNEARDSNGEVKAELHMPGTERAHIVIVRRITDDAGNLSGLLHASLSPAVLTESLQALTNVDGYLEIKQSIPGSAAVQLVKRGDEAFKDGSFSKTLPIKGTSWLLTYWPPARIAAAAHGGRGSSLPGIFLWLSFALLVLVAGGYLWRQRRRSAQAGSAVYGGAIKAFMDGAHPELSRLVPNMPGKTGGSDKGTAAAPATPPEPRDDITRVVKPETVVGASATEAPQQEDAVPVEVPEGIFRTYDIRGLVATELTPEVVEQLGRAIGSEAADRRQQGVIVGRDGRESSPALTQALIRGLRSCGVDVIDIGLVATPVLYFATHHLDAQSGVMITGSHNGPEYNGLKIVLAGETLSGDTVKALYERIRKGRFNSGNGGLQTADIIADYVRRATEDIPVALGNTFKIVIDCGNGAASVIAPQVYKALGHDVVELFCEIDGRFPNHHPDPSQPENMQALISRVQETGAALGFAFDGDGDRLGVVDGEGNIIWPDRQLMLLAKDVLSRNAGAPIIFDVKCSRYLKAIIQSAGGKPLMWKTGHSLLKAKMKETNAPLAGEMSGHIFFKERWYGFDDAIYAGARLLEILAGQKEKPTAVFADLPNGISTPELRIPLPENRHAEVMHSLRANMDTAEGELIEVDGLRIDYADGWGLIRPSNTSPYLVARFEAEDQVALERIQDGFRRALQAVDPALEPPF